MEKLEYKIGQVISLLDFSKQRVVIDPESLSTRHIGTVTRVSKDLSEIHVMWSPYAPGFLNKKEYEYGKLLSVKILNENSELLRLEL